MHGASHSTSQRQGAFTLVGLAVGAVVASLGEVLGDSLGDSLGLSVGWCVGASVGLVAAVGSRVGAAVGPGVGGPGRVQFSAAARRHSLFTVRVHSATRSSRRVQSMPSIRKLSGPVFGLTDLPRRKEKRKNVGV